MFSTSISQTVSLDPLGGFMPVQAEILRRISHAAVDIFIKYDTKCQPILYCRAGLPLKEQKLLGLTDAGIREVYVRSGDYQKFGLQLIELMELLLESDSVPAADRFAVLQLAVSVELERALRQFDCSKFVALAGGIGRNIVSCVAGKGVLPRDLFRLARHDFNTFTHVTNVASYCVVLAERMGICDSRELELIATAGILHDMGKRFIPNQILSKPSRLTPREREIVELHPTHGYEDLCDRSDLIFGQLMVVYQHHERIDGGGYPVGTEGADIHPWAKMLTVVDVFDAITGRRTYRKPASARQALEYIQQNAGTHFDSEVVRCWVSAMKNR